MWNDYLTLKRYSIYIHILFLRVYLICIKTHKSFVHWKPRSGETGPATDFLSPFGLVCGTAFNGNFFARLRTLGMSGYKVQIFL